MIIIVLISVFVFGVIHSLTAGRFKTWFRHQFGDRAFFGLYRVFYNILSLMTLAPISFLFSRYPGEIIWTIDLRWQPLLMGIQAIGVIGLIVSLLQIDFLRFIGLKQLIAYVRGGDLPLPDEKLQISGLYAFVRHPLYLFSILAICPVASMSEAYFGFCLGVTLYFVIGSIYEERRLVNAFGEDYEVYRQRVPRIAPLLRFRNKT